MRSQLEMQDVLMTFQDISQVFSTLVWPLLSRLMFESLL